MPWWEWAWYFLWPLDFDLQLLGFKASKTSSQICRAKGLLMMMMVVVVVMTTMTMMIAETQTLNPKSWHCSFLLVSSGLRISAVQGAFGLCNSPHQLALCLKRTPNRKKAEFKERELNADQISGSNQKVSNQEAGNPIFYPMPQTLHPTHCREL